MADRKKIISILFLLAGIFAIYMGLSVRLKCGGTATDNFMAGLPLTIFGVYCAITSLSLWEKSKIGDYLPALAILIAAFMLFAAVFDLSFPIIKTTCID
jgi:hypothetical protein